MSHSYASLPEGILYPINIPIGGKLSRRNQLFTSRMFFCFFIGLSHISSIKHTRKISRYRQDLSQPLSNIQEMEDISGIKKQFFTIWM